MNTSGITTIVVPSKKWYDTKRRLAKRTIKNLEKQIAHNMKRDNLSLHTTTKVTECRICGSITFSVNWRIASRKQRHKIVNDYFDGCKYCWTRHY